MRERLPLPPVSELTRLLDYDPETGSLLWKPRKPSDFVAGAVRSAEVISAWWNTRFAGKPVGMPNAHRWPYVSTILFGKQYALHRLTWKMHYGDEPDDLEAIDKNYHNLKINNYRVVPFNHGARRQKLSKNNTSGCKGVRWNHTQNVWHVTIYVRGKSIWLGRYAKLEQAVAARKAADLKYGYETLEHPEANKV